MHVGAGRHAALVAELAEWREDLCQAHTGSRVVLVKVPGGWGRSTALDRFQAGINGREDAPGTVSIRIDGQNLPGDVALQAQALRTCLIRAIRPGPVAGEEGPAEEMGDGQPPRAGQHGRRVPVVELLGLDEPGGRVQLGLGIGGLFFSGLTAGVSFLLAGVAVGAAQKAWDASPAGQDGPLARTARAVAAVSVHWPVVVIIDDADFLDAGLAVTLAENLTARHDSQVLVVAAVDPGGALARTFPTRVRQGVTSGLVYAAEADPDMGYASRLELARQLFPDLPDVGARRIAQRTASFAEVFTVAATPRLAEIGPGEDEDDDEDEVLALVDKAVGARLALPGPSPEAVVIAWAGGLVHARQADRTLGILGATRKEGDPDVRRWESIERLAGPVTPRLAGQADTDLTTRHRREMAAAFLGEALAITADPEAGLADRVAALRSAHHVRADLPDRGSLGRAQCELVATLEALGDPPAALQVATEAWARWPAGENDRRERDWIQAAQIRLSHMAAGADPGPLAQQLIAEAAEGGAAPGLEAQIWAAIILLATPRQRDAALALAGQTTAALEARTDLEAAGDKWRLLLAYHAGRAGLPDLTARLLAPLATSADPARQDAATAVQRAVEGPGADIRLQNILLESELAALSPDADDDRLRIHHALAANHATLGGYRQALAHGQHELALRTRIQGSRHPDTLDARGNIAYWTVESGDAAGALCLYQALLPDQEQVLGPRHPHTLATRADIARCTGRCGDAAGALALYQQLLPDLEQVLGPRHPDTLAARVQIADWTGESGDAAEALARYQELLPDQEEVLGPRHPHTLATRAGIASWTGHGGDAAGALARYRELLPDQEEVLGPRHPDTLTNRANIASWTGHGGDAAGALALYQQLLPDLEQVLGPRHPHTLATRRAITRLVGEGGAAAGS